MSEPDRAESTLTGGERAQLEAFLSDARTEILGLLDGLTEEQARRRLVPSLTTLLGMVAHATSVAERYRQAWVAADEVAARHGLNDVAVHHRRGPVSLRWIYLHMIRELARHAGHGDILREQILAAEG